MFPHNCAKATPDTDEIIEPLTSIRFPKRLGEIDQLFRTRIFSIAPFGIGINYQDVASAISSGHGTILTFYIYGEQNQRLPDFRSAKISDPVGWL